MAGFVGWDCPSGPLRPRLLLPLVFVAWALAASLFGSVSFFRRFDEAAEPPSFFLLPADGCFCLYCFYPAPWFPPATPAEVGLLDYWLCFLGEFDFTWLLDRDRFFDEGLLLLFVKLFLCFFPRAAPPLCGDRDLLALKALNALMIAGFSTCLYLKQLNEN